MSWASNNAWKNGSWCIISCKARFAHSRTIVNDQCCYVLVAHLCFTLASLTMSAGHPQKYKSFYSSVTWVSLEKMMFKLRSNEHLAFQVCTITFLLVPHAHKYSTVFWAIQLSVFCNAVTMQSCTKSIVRDDDKQTFFLNGGVIEKWVFFQHFRRVYDVDFLLFEYIFVISCYFTEWGQHKYEFLIS